MITKPRVRFAPSPTGYLHVGGARTALFNYLFAKKHGGTFILRIEDTDRSRYQPEALREIFESLRWLGLDWDEGPEVGGSYGPYSQSERLDHYKKYAQFLVDSGAAYYCFCTSERLDAVRAEQEKNKQSSGYDRHCRDLPKAEVEKLLAAGTPHVIRFKIPFGREVKFNDLIRGEIVYQSDLLDDLVLLKTDGFPTYHLANVVDDHLMEISHVLRGDEWITSTPRHVLLYEAFGWNPPIFAHMPVILSPDGGKLSKRKGAASVMDYQKAGYLPEALFNFLALLGWSPGDDREIMPLAEMIESFTLGNVTPKPGVLDEKKLEWMNHEYMQKMSVNEIIPLVLPLLLERGIVPAETSITDRYLCGVVTQLKDRSKKIVDLADSAVYYYRDPQSYEEAAAKKHFKEGVKQIVLDLADRLEALDLFAHDALEGLYRAYAAEKEISVGKLIHPTRLSISGVSFGAGLYELMELLGKEVVVRRLRTAGFKLTE